MAKIAFIGAGSTVFTRNLLRDLFLFPELRDVTVALMDIDPQRRATPRSWPTASPRPPGHVLRF